MLRYKLDRATYKRLKRYNKEEISVFINSLYEEAYQQGYRDGKRSRPELDVEEVYKELLLIKNIGPKRARDIADTLVRMTEEDKREID